MVENKLSKIKLLKIDLIHKILCQAQFEYKGESIDTFKVRP
jgi:hypothetical protein